MRAGAEITTDRLIIRHWRDDDLDAFHLLNSDERVMRYFPFRRSRTESAETIARFRKIVADEGLGWAAVTLRDNGEIVGLSGLANVHFEAKFTPSVEIGWRLLPDHWGKGYASEAARALVAHGFQDLGLTDIVAFAVPANSASFAVMNRIGMHPEPEFDFDMPFPAGDYEHLRRHAFYRITRQQWAASDPTAT